jgi:hypothetical protein
VAIDGASDPVVRFAIFQRQQPYDDVRPQRNGSLWPAPRRDDRLPNPEPISRHDGYLGWRHTTGNRRWPVICHVFHLGRTGEPNPPRLCERQRHTAANPWYNRAMLGPIDPLYSLSGFFVGLLVGQTGMGGGALMTPLLILLFGVHPATAVGTDLLYASATKTVGTLVHGLNHTVRWRIVALLATGNLPATALTLLIISKLDLSGGIASSIIANVLGVLLLFTSLSAIGHAGRLDQPRERSKNILLAASCATTTGSAILATYQTVRFQPSRLSSVGFSA